MSISRIIGNRPVKKSLKEYARGITGGLLFSFPLLYTMEVWWAGFSASPVQLLALMLITYLLLLGYNRYAGMRPGVSWRSVMIDSVEEIGIGLVLSFAVLLVLNRIDLSEMSLSEIMGKTIIEAMAVSIGVSIGTAQLGSREDEDEEERDEELEEEKEPGKIGMIILAFCGAIIIGGNVAPTEEVVMLAVEATPVHILSMALASLLLSVIVVYFSDFKGTVPHDSKDLLFWLTFDTCVSYLVALAASAFTLWFFGRFDNVSFWTGFSETIVLGVLASLGASARRLLIK